MEEITEKLQNMDMYNSVVSYIIKNNITSYEDAYKLLHIGSSVTQQTRFYKSLEKDFIKEKNKKMRDENNKIKDEKKIINKGTGAGGKNTNKNGKEWEQKTCNRSRLIEQGYSEHKEGYLYKKFDKYEILFLVQSQLKNYLKKELNKSIERKPDEAYIVKYNDGTITLKILEKKFQKVDGSVQDKLLGGSGIRREYEIHLGSNINVSYAFCINSYLKKKFSNKKAWKQILNENNIPVFYGEEDDYFETLDSWINNFL